MTHEARLRQAIREVGRRLYERGLIVASDGNISARLGPDRFLATPSGLCKGRLQVEQLIIVDARGRRVDRPTTANADLRPTSEMAMHLEAYRQRPEIEAVVHAHPPHVVAMSMLPGGIEAGLLPESLIFLGLPPVLDYAQPASAEGAIAIREAIGTQDALVLARHGSLTVGTSLEQAFARTETLEQLGRICWLLRAAGQQDLSTLRLGPEQAAALLALRAELGLSNPAEAEAFAARFGSVPGAER